MKKFFKKTEGFTLVELIVVIAILGILAGVGTVAYSGYIKKANLAADKQLVSALNQAFAAACIENGVNHTSITSAEESWEGKAVDGLLSVGSDKSAAIIASFTKYYAGNEASEYKLATDLAFVNGVFLHPQDKDGLKAAVQGAVAVYKQSNFSGNEEELLGAVDNVTGLFASEYLTGSNPVSQLNEGLMGPGFDMDEFKETYGLADDADADTVAKATVMYVASQANNMKSEDLMTILNTSSNPFQDAANTYGTIPTAALMYGVMTGYANSDEGAAAFKAEYDKVDPNSLSSIMELYGKMTTDDNFEDYMKAEENGLQADMDGYLSAMQVMSSYENSADWSEGFNTAEIQQLMKDVLGG